MITKDIFFLALSYLPYKQAVKVCYTMYPEWVSQMPLRHYLIEEKNRSHEFYNLMTCVSERTLLRVKWSEIPPWLELQDKYSKLIEIRFTNNFNSTLCGVQFPDSIQSIRFGFHFTWIFCSRYSSIISVNIDQTTKWPSSLRSLTFDSPYMFPGHFEPQQLALLKEKQIVSFPASITHLKIDCFNKPEIFELFEQFPPLLQKLFFVSDSNTRRFIKVRPVIQKKLLESGWKSFKHEYKATGSLYTKIDTKSEVTKGDTTNLKTLD